MKIFFWLDFTGTFMHNSIRKNSAFAKILLFGLVPLLLCKPLQKRGGRTKGQKLEYFPWLPCL